MENLKYDFTCSKLLYKNLANLVSQPSISKVSLGFFWVKGFIKGVISTPIKPYLYWGFNFLSPVDRWVLNGKVHRCRTINSCFLGEIAIA
jgi:hypothetical protein